MTKGETPGRVSYKWIALSNTTLGVLMASINQSILIIALPVIFNGLHVNPLAPGQTGLLLWVLLGYNVATTVLLVLFGRLSDLFGRVRLYNLGFLVFTGGSLLASVVWSQGTAGCVELIAARVIQGIGAGFLFSNSAAILTDAFPTEQRGLALGLNQIAAIGGNVIGLVVGGLLAGTGHWRWVFLVNVPIGVMGTVWAYIALRETVRRKAHPHLDIPGNVLLLAGLVAVMLGLTYGILPYRSYTMGWHNPWVLALLVGGVVVLAAFVVLESRTPEPLFQVRLFRIWPFTAGNLAALLSSLARGGLQFILVIWLQGIYLPMHGVRYEDTPLLAGLYTLPQMLGFLLAGPVSGYLSDRFGARAFSTLGMLVTAAGFGLMATLPMDFSKWLFWTYLFIIGVGMALFSSPNTAAIMNAVPPEHRGVASGMRSTFNNAGTMLSMGLFFSILITGLAQTLPAALASGLTTHGVPVTVAKGIASLPPTVSLFAALLGYNPLKSLLAPTGVLHEMPPQQAAYLTGQTFFPHLIGDPFMHGLRLTFLVALGMALMAALISWLRGGRYVYQRGRQANEAQAH